MKKYTLGIDYGTLSGRVVLVDVENGEEICYASKDYAHGIMDTYLPESDSRLDPETALQHPMDYLDVLKEAIPEVLKKGNVSNEQIIGVGIDFTSCTVLPIDKKGLPLCFDKKYKNRAHAYVKLWKHHSAQNEADYFNEVAYYRNESFMGRYGGRMSSEWVVPKAMEILHQDEEIYNTMDKFIEAGDWIVMMLIGEEKRSLCQAGYKAIWSKKNGYPSKEFFAELDPKMENFVDEKLSNDIYKTTDRAGCINAEGARLSGLLEGTPVAIANIDAHVALPAVKITEPGKMLMIMGTSTCHIMMSEEEHFIPGVGGVVEDGVIPGYYAYEAGQACVGDHFDWFVKNCVPSAYKDEAKQLGMDIHELLVNKVKDQQPGESGLIALDWWNGNRSILTDADLSGLLLGATLQTKPEEIYRALIEATAFGTRIIIEAFVDGGVPIDELYAAGGIAQKNAMMMQIYADVTNKEIQISASKQAPALGAALFGAVAAGSEIGGYDTIELASQHMSRLEDTTYYPIENNVKSYELLFQEYKLLHDYFGKGENDVMKRLKLIKSNIRKSAKLQ